ncbi:MAG: valine--tRNA ligase [Selenomonadaceae bacterium]|nr:valine--tRNA ligase [Selenomonadaceae bacterium]
MSNIPKTYEPQKIEKEIYAAWERDKNFHTTAEAAGEPYCIVIPPPNVTGQLHMGHALDETLQDILIRYHRMKGDNTLWMPGTDHAGIATQARVEEQLRGEGTNRYELGREKFLERVWQWKEKFGNRISYQLRTLGSSCDWERERFTMDAGCSAAVRKVFVQLYNEGLIYRGTRITNWCPNCNTALSDIEVEHEDEQGHLWHLRYPFADGSGYVEVATTRPETMLGDTGVAVHPDDDRYKNLVGKTLILPLVNREIPLFADSYVDKEFGTGAVKVTPAHDPNDFEMGLRHNLPQIKVINNDGTMTGDVGKYSGLDRYKCREEIVKDLEAGGFLVKVENHAHAVGHCQRCHTTIEPLISEQWFVKMETLAAPAIEAVKSGALKFVPERFTKIYINWLENIRDWCISRQLWWGHQIPAWYCDDCGEMTVSEVDVHECPHCHGKNLRRDEDVLDTWFSSALWPFSTMGWPNETPELKKFYPTSVLVTGYDIIFFWVSRMVMMGLKFRGEVPFRYVFIHGLVRDKFGRKMSKSLGNGVDPVEIINKYGADSLRFMLVTGNTPGNDLRFFDERVESARNFANKIWNASRFLLMNLEGFDPTFKPTPNDLELADKWILQKLAYQIETVTENLERFELGEAARQLYELIWFNFCDYYIELAKARLYGDDPRAKATALFVLTKVLEVTLRLLHPFMPFLTEVIRQKLPNVQGSIMLAPWPTRDEFKDFIKANDDTKKAASLIFNTVRTIRNLKSELGIDSRKKAAVVLKVTNAADKKILAENLRYLTDLTFAEPITFAEEKPAHAMSGVIDGAEIYLPLAGLIDTEKEIARLTKELEKIRKGAASTAGKLNNERFVSKAPAEVVQAERDKLSAAEEKISSLEQRIKQLENL